MAFQPPSGGCVLKLWVGREHIVGRHQPPSGGCVLKLNLLGEGFGEVGPAAFGRLCVETF